MSAADTHERPGHPSPHRERVSGLGLIAAAAGAPLAWAVQLIVNYALAAYACYPRGQLVHEPGPGWGWLTTALAAVQLLTLLVALLSALTCWRFWQRTRGEAGSGSAGGLLQEGEGRTRFIALGGLLAALGFAVAILFDAIALIGVPLCGG